MRTDTDIFRKAALTAIAYGDARCPYAHRQRFATLAATLRTSGTLADQARARLRLWERLGPASNLVQQAYADVRATESRFCEASKALSRLVWQWSADSMKGAV